MVRSGLVGVVLAATLVASCASAEQASDTASSPSSTSTSAPTTTVTAVASTSTSTTSPTTTSSTTTSTTVPPDPGVAASWIGVNFLASAEGFQARDEILKNLVGSMPVELLVNGEPADLYPWFSGFTSSQRGDRMDVLVVGAEPTRYPPPDYEGSIDDIDPVDPDPDVTYRLMVWSLALSPTIASGYRVVDAIEIDVPATILASRGFISVGYQPWACEIDASLEGSAVFGFFDDRDDLKIETHYPAFLAFSDQDDSLSIVPPDMVRCIVRTDPENF